LRREKPAQTAKPLQLVDLARHACLQLFVPSLKFFGLGAYLSGARLQFLELAHVFESDHALLGESLDEVDPAVFETPNFAAIKRNDAYGLVAADQGDRQNGPDAFDIGSVDALGLAIMIELFGCDVFDLFFSFLK
jgi:hypothetical protein